MLAFVIDGVVVVIAVVEVVVVGDVEVVASCFVYPSGLLHQDVALASAQGSRIHVISHYSSIPTYICMQ